MRSFSKIKPEKMISLVACGKWIRCKSRQKKAISVVSSLRLQWLILGRKQWKSEKQADVGYIYIWKTYKICSWVRCEGKTESRMNRSLACAMGGMIVSFTEMED